MMIIELASLEGSSLPFDFTLSPDEIDLDIDEGRLTRDVRVKGELTKRIIETDVVGTIDTAIELACTRCLQPIAESISIPFDVSFVAPEHFPEAKEVEIKGEDLEADAFNGDRIDLKELVREQILLSLPEQLFCKEDCKGLCAKCGANRNLIDCNCEENEIDPRWSALKGLK
jgi:uncharacterized protein